CRDTETTGADSEWEAAELTTSSPESSRVDDARTVDFASHEPIVLRGVGADWPVFAALREERLREDAERPVEVEELDGTSTTVSLGELLDDMRASRPRGLYMRHQLVSKFDPGLWELVPRHVRRLNWLLALPAEARPDWAWLMIGAAGTRSDMHVDVMASAAWNLLCAGCKKWTFHSRDRAVEWNLLPAGCAEPSEDARCVEFFQEPGDVVITPSGWAHEVHNVTGTVSVTANFVNASNLDFAKRYFEVVGDAANLGVLAAVGEAFSRLGND
ncbi:MAG: hypothetical protein ACRDXX_00275, partial [Stackebrandtia sp.]